MSKPIKPGSLVSLKKDKSYLDFSKEYVLGWHENKIHYDINMELFAPGTKGLFLKKWSGPGSKLNPSDWFEVLIGTKVYLFALNQLQPV